MTADIPARDIRPNGRITALVDERFTKFGRYSVARPRGCPTRALRKCGDHITLGYDVEAAIRGKFHQHRTCALLKKRRQIVELQRCGHDRHWIAPTVSHRLCTGLGFNEQLVQDGRFRQIPHTLLPVRPRHLRYRVLRHAGHGVAKRIRRVDGHQPVFFLTAPQYVEHREVIARLHKAMIAHPAVAVRFGEIAEARIRKKYDDHIVCAEFRLVLPHPAQHAGHDHPARLSDEETLLRSQTTCHQHRLAIRHTDVVIDDAKVHIFSQDVLAHALGHVGIDLLLVEDAGVLVLEVHRSIWIDAYSFDRRVLLLQIARAARARAARSCPRHEMRDAALGLRPELRAGCLIMGYGVGWIVVLIQIYGIGDLRGQPPSDRVVRPRIIRCDVRRANDDFGAESTQDVDLLLALLVGGGEDAAVAFRDGHQGEAGAGIAAGAFDYGTAGPQRSVPLGRLNHCEPNAILDGSTGVEVLNFDEDGTVELGEQAIELNKRRIADCAEDILMPHPNVLSLVSLRFSF